VRTGSSLEALGSGRLPTHTAHLLVQYSSSRMTSVLTWAFGWASKEIHELSKLLAKLCNYLYIDVGLHGCNAS
jgi:hypothetical protein